jgi:hypothetical protein
MTPKRQADMTVVLNDFPPAVIGLSDTAGSPNFWYDFARTSRCGRKERQRFIAEIAASLRELSLKRAAAASCRNRA